MDSIKNKVWVNIDDRKVKNIGGHHFVSHVYGLHGDLWPRMVISSRVIKGEFLFSVTKKNDPEASWEDVYLPAELCKYFGDLIFETKTKYEKTLEGADELAHEIKEKFGFDEIVWIEHPTWKLILCKGDDQIDFSYHRFTLYDVNENCYGVGQLFEKIVEKTPSISATPIIPDSWVFDASSKTLKL